MNCVEFWGRGHITQKVESIPVWTLQSQWYRSYRDQSQRISLLSDPPAFSNEQQWFYIHSSWLDRLLHFNKQETKYWSVYLQTCFEMNNNNENQLVAHTEKLLEKVNHLVLLDCAVTVHVEKAKYHCWGKGVVSYIWTALINHEKIPLVRNYLLFKICFSSP